jgi:hypothetical protein
MKTDLVTQALPLVDPLPLDNADLTKVALFLLEGLAGNVMSGDVWALSMYAARDRARDYGMSKEAFDLAHAQIAKAVFARRRCNPIHSMFD